MEWVLKIMVVIILALIAWTDWKTMEIPDWMNLSLAVCAVINMFIENNVSVFERVIGAFCVSVPMYLLILRIPAAFGGGDIKLTSAIGLYLGWKKTLTGTFLAFLIGGLQGSYLLVSGKAKRGEGAHMAFGPALCIGYAAAMFAGNEILQWYLSLFY